MSELAIGLIKQAVDDFEAGKLMFEKGKYSKTIENCQQFVEKMLRAVLNLEGHGTIVEHQVTGCFISEMMGKVKGEKWIQKVKEIADI